MRGPVDRLFPNLSPRQRVVVDWIITIDCDGWHVTNGAGVEYDIIGSFPQLYPPAGTVNAFTFTVTTGVNALAGATLAVSYTNRFGRTRSAIRPMRFCGASRRRRCAR